MEKRLFTVIKWNGETEFFDPEKLKNSLFRSGASETVSKRILEHIENKLTDGMKTATIYEYAFGLLKKSEPGIAARYDLKKAILRLGPSGYPFEQFVSRLFEHFGYRVQTGIMVQGHCVEHEVDVVAENNQEILMMECKYHNFHDTNSDLKTALYVHSRMEDLKAAWQEKNPSSSKIFKGYLVTNTKVSETALRYAECSGLLVISWSYPKGSGLAKLIDVAGLHPVTCLTTLTEMHIKTLLNSGHVLCRDVPQFAKDLQLSREQEKTLHRELDVLLQAKP